MLRQLGEYAIGEYLVEDILSRAYGLPETNEDWHSFEVAVFVVLVFFPRLPAKRAKVLKRWKDFGEKKVRDNVLTKDGFLHRVPQWYRWREVAETAVKYDVFDCLWAAPPKLRDDKAFVKYACDGRWQRFVWASEKLRGDPEYTKSLIESLRHGSFFLKYADENLRDDATVVELACKFSPSAIQYASLRLQRRSVLMGESDAEG